MSFIPFDLNSGSQQPRRRSSQQPQHGVAQPQSPHHGNQPPPRYSETQFMMPTQPQISQQPVQQQYYQHQPHQALQQSSSQGMHQQMQITRTGERSKYRPVPGQQQTHVQPYKVGDRCVVRESFTVVLESRTYNVSQGGECRIVAVQEVSSVAVPAVEAFSPMREHLYFCSYELPTFNGSYGLDTETEISTPILLGHLSTIQGGEYSPDMEVFEGGIMFLTQPTKVALHNSRTKEYKTIKLEPGTPLFLGKLVTLPKSRTETVLSKQLYSVLPAINKTSPLVTVGCLRHSVLYNLTNSERAM